MAVSADTLSEIDIGTRSDVLWIGRLRDEDSFAVCLATLFGTMAGRGGTLAGFGAIVV